MADIIVTAGRGAPTKFRDNGDNSYSEAVPSPAAYRNAGILHRNGITSADTLALPATPTASDVVETSATLANSAMHFAVSAGNRWGPTTATIDGGAITPTLNHGLLVVVAQVVGADYYDIFLSTAAAPLWVGRITEAQRATGDRAIITVGVVTARSSATVVGTIVVGIVGTGLASNVNPFAVNNAYKPTAPTAINCAGFSKAHLHVKLAVTDLRSLPTLVVTPFYQDQTSTGDWFAGAQQTVSLLTAVGQVLEQDLTLTIDGATGLVVLVQSIAGQGAAASIWVELA